MNFSLNQIGTGPSHVSTYMKNLIRNSFDVSNISSVKVLADDTLFDVDGKHYLLLAVTLQSGVTISITEDGDTSFSALINGIRLVNERLRTLSTPTAVTDITVRSHRQKTA